MLDRKRSSSRILDSVAALVSAGLAVLLSREAIAHGIGPVAQEASADRGHGEPGETAVDPETTASVDELEAALSEFDRLIANAMDGAGVGRGGNGGPIYPIEPGMGVHVSGPSIALPISAATAVRETDGGRLAISRQDTGPEALARLPILGTGNDDILYGTGADDRIAAFAGDDLIIGSAGADRMDGGSGTDIVSYVDSDAAVFVSLALGTARGGHAEGDVLVGIDGLFGSSFGDMLEGNDDANVLSGLAGDDTLIGGGGDDWLIGGAGADQLIGGDGIDTAEYRGGTGPVVIDLGIPGNNQGDAAGDTFVSVERFYLSDGDDRFTGADETVHVNGEGGDDVITGSDKDDTLVGGDGDDILSGGQGDDWFDGGSGADWIDGGDGYDTLDYRAAHDAIAFDATGNGAGEAGGDRIVSVERILGSEFGDTFRMDGTDGIALELNGGNDTCFGGSGSDLVSGGNGDDWLAGYDGDDVLIGDAGDDFLWGGEGHDQLTGGAGSDRFVFDQGGQAFTRVTDFSDDDVIVVDSAAFADFDAIQNAMWMEGDTTFIANIGGGWLALHHVDMASLTASDFVFDAII